MDIISDTLESLRRKRGGAAELESLVRTMKAMAASNIIQYETAVNALEEYYRTLSLGIKAYFSQQENTAIIKEPKKSDSKLIRAVVFGSDQGLVGSFNDSLAGFVKQTLDYMPGKKEVWAVGERIYPRLCDSGLATTKLFTLPTSVKTIAPLMSLILIESDKSGETGSMDEFYIFHNAPSPGIGYAPFHQRMLPLDEKWKDEFTELTWPTKNLPQVQGNAKATLSAIIREYLFVSLFKACVESLASENASRLETMQRAEKNIDEMLETLNQSYNRLRQDTIDEELFDVISGFEALKDKSEK